MKFGPRSQENNPEKVPHTLELDGENVLNDHNSAADCSISLKFCIEFEHMTPEVLQKFKVKRSKVKVTARRNGAKICEIMNNSAGNCSISIKFTTHHDHVTPDLPQTFKINGSHTKVIA